MTFTSLSVMAPMTSSLARVFNAPRSRHVVVQTLVSVTLSYQLLYGEDAILSRDAAETLVAGLMMMVLVLAMLPRIALESAWLPGVLIAVNTVAVTGTIYVSGSTKSELLFSFFLLMLVAGSARTLGQFLGLSLLLCAGSGALLYEHILETGVFSVGHLLGIPLLLVMAVFYGVTLEGLMQERRVKTNAARDGERFREAEETLSPAKSLSSVVIAGESEAIARQHLDRQLRQAKRMEAYSRIAGGIAKEFGELLTCIGSRSGKQLSTLKPGDPLYQPMEDIFKSGERAASLTSRLMALDRAEDRPLEPVRLDVTLSEFRGVLQGLLPNSIDLQLDHEAKPLTVYADREQIEHVLLHLAINARDSMPKGGHLIIGMEPVGRQHLAAMSRKSSQSARAVRLSVSDTGCGMTAETQTRMFEPLFSTKSANVGLGLPIVYGIVKTLGGDLEVDSKLGQGTTIHLYLPQADGQVPKHNGINQAVMATGNETVLVVEDDEVLRKLTVAALARHKYQVVEAASPVEALLVAQKHAGSIHVTIAGLVMPEIGGYELIQRLRSQRPTIKSLFVSGYGDEVVLRDRIRPQLILPRPYRQTTLLEKIRDVLDAA